MHPATFESVDIPAGSASPCGRFAGHQETFSDEWDIANYDISYGIRDINARQAGVRVVTYRKDILPCVGGDVHVAIRQEGTERAAGRGWFVLRVREIRNERLFGKVIPPLYYKTAEERTAALNAYVVAATKRAAKR